MYFHSKKCTVGSLCMNLIIYNSEINFQQYVMFRTIKEVPTNVEMLVSFVCPDCGKDFAQQSNLNKHIKTVHQNKQDFKCVTCGKGFGKKDHLTRHIKCVHNLEKRYLCTQCEKRFGQACDLARHVESIHEGIVYPCNKCEYKASTKSNLASHVKIVHMHIYPVRCVYCEYGCAHKCFLEAHVKKKHPTEHFLEQEEYERKHAQVCKICRTQFQTKIELDRHVKYLHNHSMSM